MWIKLLFESAQWENFVYEKAERLSYHTDGIFQSQKLVNILTA